MKSSDEIAEKAFNIPTLYVTVAYLLVTIVLAIGVGLSIRLGDWMWLARFGAFLVCLAMIFEVTGILEKYVTKVMSIVEGVTVEVALMQVERLPHLYGINSETSDQQINEISEKEHKRRLILANDVIRSTISRKVQRHEFFVALAGTLLWAFADLLNKI